MAEAAELSHAWWDPATAVTYLCQGCVPAKIDRWSLPGAVEEMQRLNAAVQSDKIEARIIPFNGGSYTLKAEQKACITLRFSQMAFTGGNIGVVLEIIDRDTGERRRDIKSLELKAADVQALITRGVLDPAEASAEAAISAEISDTTADLLTATEAREQNRRGRGGSKPKYDWEALQSECFRRLHEDGVPDNRNEFGGELLEWYDKQFGEDRAPDATTLKPYLKRWIEAFERSLPRND
jgi:hypothetical protein